MSGRDESRPSELDARIPAAAEPDAKAGSDRAATDPSGGCPSTGDMLPTANAAGAPAPGGEPEPALVDPSHYLVLGEVARGGLGRILAARDRRLGRNVALKELLPEGGASAPRFLREALITARLQHPSIVPVYEAGYFTSGAPFYAM